MIQGRLTLLKVKKRTIYGELGPDRPGSIGMDGQVCFRWFQTAVESGQEKKEKHQSEKNGRVPNSPPPEVGTPLAKWVGGLWRPVDPGARIRRGLMVFNIRFPKYIV